VRPIVPNQVEKQEEKERREKPKREKQEKRKEEENRVKDAKRKGDINNLLGKIKLYLAALPFC